MVTFPVRKCYHAVNIVLSVALVVTILHLFEDRRDTLYPLEVEYERQILEDEARIVPELGKGGTAAHLYGDDKVSAELSMNKYDINVYLSDRILYNRTLKDCRHPSCKDILYDAELPSASVILVFHNEPYSVVIRTIWSVINSVRRSNPWFKHANYVERHTGRVTNVGYPGQDPNSPFVYLKEIILVDDNSTLPELKGKLSHYVRTRLPPDLIRILRLPDRIGLTQARMAGARAARANIMVFLDSHCECLIDWLRPLLYRIKQKRTAVVTPFIDVIDKKTFKYVRGELKSSSDYIGGFLFAGIFDWINVSPREVQRRGADTAPTWSPTMAGGLFAISRDYFWELGAYDEQMGGWGGENLEMSFRIWQCGGTLEAIPCSRVGHIFRNFNGYSVPVTLDTIGINTARMAEVWMDEYAELFYLYRPDLRNNSKIGDVTHRKVLREKLKCKSFQWYLDNIYKEKFVPTKNVQGYGRFKNEATQLCLENLKGINIEDQAPLNIQTCHHDLLPTQHFSLSYKGELRDEQNCATIIQGRKTGATISSLMPMPYSDESNNAESQPVVMITCDEDDPYQKWDRLPTGQLQHNATKLCLAVQHEINEAILNVCQPDNLLQMWDIEHMSSYNHTL